MKTIKNPEAYILNRIKTRARAAKIPFNLQISDIIIPPICPILHIPIYFNNGTRKKNSVSIDRIDPNKGYTKGNIMIMSSLANTMKNNATPQELLIFAGHILKIYRTK